MVAAAVGSAGSCPRKRSARMWRRIDGMHFFSPIRPLLKGWLFSSLVFGALAFVLVGQFALAVSMPLSEVLRTAGRDWLPWAIVAPLSFRLVSRLPLERDRWRIAWPVHIAAGLVTVA